MDPRHTTTMLVLSNRDVRSAVRLTLVALTFRTERFEYD